jgi:hypothetical protein
VRLQAQRAVAVREGHARDIAAAACRHRRYGRASHQPCATASFDKYVRIAPSRGEGAALGKDLAFPSAASPLKPTADESGLKTAPLMGASSPFEYPSRTRSHRSHRRSDGSSTSRSCVHFPRTVTTGQGAARTTRSATLPRKNFSNPRRPCVPITIRSDFVDRQARMICSAASP